MGQYFYADGQVENIFDVWPSNAQWLIVGGPADGNEAQVAKKRFPDLRCVGFDPNPSALKFQAANGFPGDLYPYALWDEDRPIDLALPRGRPRSASVCRDLRGAPCEIITAQAKTLDSLDRSLGPFNNAVLWIDIEFAELRCLKGAYGLLERGSILLINLESFIDIFDKIRELLEGHDMKLVKVWNDKTMPNRFDAVFSL